MSLTGDTLCHHVVTGQPRSPGRRQARCGGLCGDALRQRLSAVARAVFHFHGDLVSEDAGLRSLISCSIRTTSLDPATLIPPTTDLGSWPESRLRGDADRAIHYGEQALDLISEESILRSIAVARVGSSSLVKWPARRCRAWIVGERGTLAGGRRAVSVSRESMCYVRCANSWPYPVTWNVAPASARRFHSNT